MFSKKILLLFCICVVMVLFMINKLRLHTDITDFFFESDTADSAFLINQLNSDALQRRIILSVAHPGATEQTVTEFIDPFQTSLKTLDSVQRVWSSSLDQSDINQLIDVYTRYKVLLLSLNPEQDIPELFDSARLRQRVEMIKTALLGPESILLRSQIRADPMLLILDWLERIQMSFSRSNEDQNYTLFFVESKAAGMDINAQQNLLQQINSAFDQHNGQFDRQFELEMTGVPIFALEIKSRISGDIQKVGTLSAVVILILFVIVFGSTKALFLTAMMLLITVGGAILITQSVFGFVHGLTLGLGLTLIGICIDYFIHAMIHGSADGLHQCLNNVRRIWLSLILGGLTTVIGYTALAVSGFPGLQQIAIFSASGIIIALLLARFVIPDLMIASGLVLQPRLSSKRLLTMLNTNTARVLLPGAAVICFVTGMFGIQWSDNIDTLSPDVQHLKDNDEKIRSRMTSINPGRFILVESDDLESALQMSEKAHQLLETLRQQGAVDAFFPLFPWIASKDLQTRNAQVWNSVIESDRTAIWKNELSRQGFEQSAFPPLAASPDDLLELEIVNRTAGGQLLAHQLIRHDEGVFVVIWLGNHDDERVKSALQSVSGVRYFSKKDEINKLAHRYRIKAIYMLFYGLAAIVALLTWRFRSITVAVKVLSPGFLAIVFVFGIAGLLGNPLNVLHVIGLLLIAAICVDYGIFYCENRSKNPALNFQAISASALTSSASFACLGIAQNPALQTLAWTVAPGIVIGFLLCPVILRVSLNKI